MASENSPVDTDNDSIECFQNYTASEVFVQGLAGLVDQQDVESMIRAQKQILQRFEKTNEMLSNCNSLSSSRLKIAGQQFKNYKQILVDIKKDLDHTFKKINILKTKLQLQYPESIVVASNKIDTLNEESKELEENLSNTETVTCIETSKPINHDSTNDSKSLSDILNKKIDISDSNSSENGADSHAETTSTSNSDTA